MRLDLQGLKCPLPALRTKRALHALPLGGRIVVVCSDPLAGIDIPNLLRETGDTLERLESNGGLLAFHIVKGPA